MNKKQQLKLASNLLTRGRTLLDDWIDTCKSDPGRAFNFFPDAMIGYAKIHVGERCSIFASNDGDLVTLAQRELRSMGMSALRSTGVLDLEIKQYVMAEWTQLLHKIEMGEDC
jgi:hypothetical protein